MSFLITASCSEERIKPMHDIYSAGLRCRIEIILSTFGHLISLSHSDSEKRSTKVDKNISPCACCIDRRRHIEANTRCFIQ